MEERLGKKSGKNQQQLSADVYLEFWMLIKAAGNFCETFLFSRDEKSSKHIVDCRRVGGGHWPSSMSTRTEKLLPSPSHQVRAVLLGKWVNVVRSFLFFPHPLDEEKFCVICWRRFFSVCPRNVLRCCTQHKFLWVETKICSNFKFFYRLVKVFENFDFIEKILMRWRKQQNATQHMFRHFQSALRGSCESSRGKFGKFQ